MVGRDGTAPAPRGATGVREAKGASSLRARRASEGLALVLACLGCGARTDVERRPAVDRDAGIFDTFPCRWTSGPEVEVARADDVHDLTGAMHPDGSQVAVFATVGGERLGARVSIHPGPDVLERLGPFEGRLFSGTGGWLRQLGDACAIAEHDFRFAQLDEVAWGEAPTCALTQSVAGRLESLPVPRGTAFSVRMPGGSLETLAALDVPVESGSILRDDTGVVIAVVIVERRLVVLRIGAPGGAQTLELGIADAVSAAPDRLFGGAVVLYREEAGDFRLVRVRFEGAFEPTPVADLAGLTAPPVGALVSNETEVLLPLADGSMAFVPLNRSIIRTMEPIPSGAVEAMEIVLVPGGSAGGLLFAQRDGRQTRLAFRRLVCNR